MVTHDAKAAEYGTRLVKIKDGFKESDTTVKNQVLSSPNTEA